MELIAARSTDVIRTRLSHSFPPRVGVQIATLTDLLCSVVHGRPSLRPCAIFCIGAADHTIISPHHIIHWASQTHTLGKQAAIVYCHVGLGLQNCFRPIKSAADGGRGRLTRIEGGSTDRGVAEDGRRSIGVGEPRQKLL